MHAEIIAIGDEITSGQLLDTNTQWLSLRLEELGIRVLYHSTVGDDIGAMAGVFREAIRRADVILATGGLGPTADDVTREAIADATGCKLAIHPEAMEDIRALFARRKRQMPKQNESQAMFPEGSGVIPNPNGTAPGIVFHIPRAGAKPCSLYALPGVPAEMREMWYGTVADSLREIGGGQSIVRHRQIKCFGAGESQVEAMLPDLIRRGREPRVGITASRTTIILRITAAGATEEACYAAMEPTIATIHQHLGKLVFGSDDDELQDAVVRLLRQRDKTLATAEWGTAGLVADLLGSVTDGQGYYLGGIVVPDESSLTGALEVPADLVRQHSATSPEVVGAMAANCREKFRTDFGLAIGRFPPFDPAAEKPSPMYLALATSDGVTVKSHGFAGHPATLKILAAKRALDLVRLAMLLVCVSLFHLWAGSTVVAEDRIAAFPNAEGFGMYTKGGRGGRVLQVTSLADYDPKRAEPILGTLRAACDAKGPRTVVFRVSGTIELATGLIITEPFLTIAGQTAPGGGVCVKGYGTSIRTSEVIVRCLRFRPGDESGKEVDALSISSYKIPGDWPVRNVIVDHCSASWATDEVLSVSGEGITDVSVQWCIISESLNRSVHDKGAHGYASLIKCNGDVTFHHNLYAHHSSRSPRPGTYGEGSILLDFRNNLIYNAYGYSAADPVRMNYVGNSIKHFKLDKAFSIGGAETKMYIAGNVMETAKGAAPGGWELISKAKDENKMAAPFDVAAVATDTAPEAHRRILRSSGATVPARDAVDARVVADVTAGSGRIIDSQTDVGGWPELQSALPPPDTDNDGMPDAWEKKHGLLPEAADQNFDPDGDGYTNLEEFLNFTDPNSGS